MLRIRLSRTGAKKQPSYRIVVADAKFKRDGRVVERIGYYNPRTEPLEYRIDESRALYWLSVGAQPSDAVRRLLDKQGTLERLDRHRQGESLELLTAEFSGEELVTTAEGVQKEVEEIEALATVAVSEEEE